MQELILADPPLADPILAEPPLPDVPRPVAVHLPPDLVQRVDEAARDEMRSRTNMVKVLIAQGLQRRADEPKTS
jgi:hypothetical protein